jgi:hypothetical protein
MFCEYQSSKKVLQKKFQKIIFLKFLRIFMILILIYFNVKTYNWLHRSPKLGSFKVAIKCF